MWAVRKKKKDKAFHVVVTVKISNHQFKNQESKYPKGIMISER